MIPPAARNDAPRWGESGMYRVELGQSLFPAQRDLELSHISIGDALRDAAARWPDRESLVEAFADGRTGRRWSFSQLRDDSERLARALLTRFKPGERITVWAPNTPEWVLLEYALALASMTLVTANPAFKARELSYVLRQSGSVGLFHVREHRGNPMAEIAAEMAAELPELRDVVDMEDPDALFRLAGEPPELPTVRHLDPAQIQYTSGTTGFPKGVMLHHHGLINNSRHHFASSGLREGDRTLLMMPLFHTGGCALGLLGALQAGCCSVLLRQFDGLGAYRLTESEGLAGILGVPTMLQAIVEAHAASPRPLPALRIAASGGAMVPPELVRELTSRLECEFIIVYGQTESSPLLAQTRPGDSWQDNCETLGQPMPHTDVGIFDIDSGAVMPVGEVGEIRARGYQVMLGYHDDPQATARTIDADGWLHTGDLGTMDVRGYVRITGRVKDIIIRGGENLFPAEIENVLLEHPDVAEVAVVGVPCPRMGEAVAAFIRPLPGKSMDSKALAAHCRAQIAAQKTPAHWIEVSSFPLTGSGKIQKFELRRRWEEEQSGVPA
jgi:fatty-acyl-CoA synthase